MIKSKNNRINTNLEDPLVSVIMPSYNTARFIKDSIYSVINQTYSNIELIIVDDNSNDSSNEIIKTIINENSHFTIKHIVNQVNLGAAKSRNIATNLAEGKYIAFLDSDDLWSPCKLRIQIDYMESNKVYFSYTSYFVIDEEAKYSGKFVTGPKIIRKTLMNLTCWPGCLTVIYNQNQLGKFFIKEIKKNNDYALWLKVVEKADCYLLDYKLAAYRKRNGSLSNISKFKLLKWHYVLFRHNQNCGILKSTLMVIINSMFTLLKKLIYVRKVKNEKDLSCYNCSQEI